MEKRPAFIPRPVVRTNQWIIVLSVLLTWITGQFWLLLIPLLSGLSGLLFQFNPIMQAAKHFLKKPFSSYIPEDKAQQQFNQMLAVLFLSGAFISYLFDWSLAGHLFSALVFTAAFVAIMGFCIGCFIHYQLTQYRHRRKANVD